MADNEKKTDADKDDLPPPEFIKEAEGDLGYAQYLYHLHCLKQLNDD